MTREEQRELLADAEFLYTTIGSDAICGKLWLVLSRIIRALPVADRIDPPPPAPCPTCARYVAALVDIAAEGCQHESQTEPRRPDCQCSPCVAARALKGADHDDHE